MVRFCKRETLFDVRTTLGHWLPLPLKGLTRSTRSELVNFDLFRTDNVEQGPIADAIVKKVQETGGILTNDDLESYTVKVEPALVGSYRGRRVYTTHAPTSGPVLLHMLNLLERYDLKGEGRTPLNTHRLVEVLKCTISRFLFIQTQMTVLYTVGFAARLNDSNLCCSQTNRQRQDESLRSCIYE